MDNKNEVIQMAESKENKISKQVKAERQTVEETLIIAYAQLVFHTLQQSGTEITPRAIREEVKMFYSKFGNQEVKRLANIIVKEKRQ